MAPCKSGTWPVIMHMRHYLCLTKCERSSQVTEQYCSLQEPESSASIAQECPPSTEVTCRQGTIPVALLMTTLYTIVIIHLIHLVDGVDILGLDSLTASIKYSH